MTLGGATIDVAVDRSFVDAGDTVHVTLTARQASDAKVAVAVLVMESVGSGGGRVETPPRRLARETVTFAAGATGVLTGWSFTAASMSAISRSTSESISVLAAMRSVSAIIS